MFCAFVKIFRASERPVRSASAMSSRQRASAGDAVKSLSGVPEPVVRLAELVDEPHDLVLVPHEVRRKLHRDDEVHGLAVGLGDVEKAPRERRGQDLLPGIPLERQAHELGLVAGRTELANETVGVPLGAARGERHLRVADEDAGHLQAYFTPVTA